MAARATGWHGDRSRDGGVRLDPSGRSASVRNHASEAGCGGKRDGRDTDRKAGHNGFAHVVASHGRMGHADREGERRDGYRGDDAGSAASKFPAQ